MDTSRTRLTFYPYARLLALVSMVLTLGLGLGAAPAVAATGTITVGLLGMDGANAPAAVGPAVTDALRRAIPKFSSIRIEMSQQDPAELKLVFGCTDERPDCMAKVGKSLSVGRLIYGSLLKQQGSGVYTVTLKQLNVADATVEKFVSDTVPATVLAPGNAELDTLVEKWLRVLLIEGLRGGLRVQSEPPNATVQVDGSTVGTTPITLNDLEVGNHVVKVELFGHLAMERPVTVRGGMVHDVSVQLSPRLASAQPGGTQTVSSNRTSRGLRYTSYVFYGLAAVSALAAIGTWRSYLGNEDVANAHLDQLQADLKPSGMLANYKTFFGSSTMLSSCSGPAALNMYTSYKGYVGECQSGNTLAGASTGLWIATAAFAALGVSSTIVSAVLRRSETKMESDHPAPAAGAGGSTIEVTPPPPPPPASTAPRLEGVAPAVGPTGGGAVLLFSF